MSNIQLKRKISFQISAYHLAKKAIVFRLGRENQYQHLKIEKTFLTQYSKYLNTTRIKHPNCLNFNQTKDDMEHLLQKYKLKYNIIFFDYYMAKGSSEKSIYPTSIQLIFNTENKCVEYDEDEENIELSDV